MNLTELPRVALVGAGPGHPELLTLRAAELLRLADLVLYDKLVPAETLAQVRTDANCVCVTEISSDHPYARQPVVQAMIDAAREGKRVVRLKGGDPSIFGRSGEEAEGLAEAGVPFEIVPGVTAALGAAAFAGIPLTHRTFASGVAFVTGHEHPGKPGASLDWAALAQFPGTLVVYMGMSRLDRIVAQLLEHGKPASTPAAVVQWATLGDQRTEETTLGQLPDSVRAGGYAPPALVIVGDVVSLRAKLGWFERLPLCGKRVLIARPRAQGEEFARRIVAWGGVPRLLPTVAIQEPADWSPVDLAIQNLAQWHWLAFTSANGVRAFFDRLRLLGYDLRSLGAIRLAAIGPKTADTLRELRLEPDLVPERFQSEDLAAALLERSSPGERILLARADRGRDVLRETLAAQREVEQIAVYAQVDVDVSASPILDELRRGEIDFVALTSTNIARVLLDAFDDVTRGRVLAGDLRLVTISPVTSDEVTRHGLPVAAESAEATLDGVLASLVALASSE